MCSCIPVPPAFTCSCLGCAAPSQSQPMPSGSVPDSSFLGPGPELRRCSWRYLISKMIAANINSFSIYIIVSFFMWQCVKTSKNTAQLKPLSFESCSVHMAFATSSAKLLVHKDNFNQNWRRLGSGKAFGQWLRCSCFHVHGETPLGCLRTTLLQHHG